MQKEIEAILFLSGGYIKKSKLAKTLKLSESKLNDELTILKETRKNSGVVILDDGISVSLVTNPVAEKVIQSFIKTEKETPLSRAAQETLSIIAYTGPVDKPSLDALRGVNAHTILQKLLIKGLVQKTKGESSEFYSITTEFLTHMKLTKVEDLPDYGNNREKLLKAIQFIDTESKEGRC